jgi:hypothetical protein
MHALFIPAGLSLFNISAFCTCIIYNGIDSANLTPGAMDMNMTILKTCKNINCCVKEEKTGC